MTLLRVNFFQDKTVQLNLKLSTIDHYRTPPPAAPPLSALRAAEEDIAWLPNFTIFKLFPTSPFSQPLPATSFNLAIQLLYLRIHFQQHTTLSQKTRLIAQTTGEDIATLQHLTELQTTAKIKIRNRINPQQKKERSREAGAPLTR